MIKLKHIKWLYLVEGLFCYLFFYHSNGLAFSTNDGYQYVNELYSSGSDDDVAIMLVGLICGLTIILLLISKSLIYTNVIVALSLILQLLSLIIIQVGSIYITLFQDFNVYLYGIVIAQLLILGVLFKENMSS